MSTLVDTAIVDHIQTITFNRPDKKNAFTSEMYIAVAEAVRAADANEDVRCTILTGAGDMFTAGNDVADFMKTPPAGAMPPAYQMLFALFDAKKPIIAAVNGLGVGIGMTMLPHCDIVVIDENAGLKAPFVDLALAPEGGSSMIFPDLFGRSLASEILLAGRTITAAEALAGGIASSVAPAGTALPVAQALAANISGKARQSVMESKRLLTQPRQDVLRQHMMDELEIFMARMKSPEVAEVVTAFLEKRAPNFT